MIKVLVAPGRYVQGAGALEERVSLSPRSESAPLLFGIRLCTV